MDGWWWGWYPGEWADDHGEVRRSTGQGLLINDHLIGGKEWLPLVIEAITQNSMIVVIGTFFRLRLFNVLLLSNCIPKHGRKPLQTYYMVKTNTVKLSLYVQKKKLKQ